MKKAISAISLAAFMALTGCSNRQEAPADQQSADSSIALATPDHGETEIALVTCEPEPEDETKPPQLLVEYSGNGLACAAVMTLGNYTWDNNGQAANACGTDPVECAENGSITAKVDLDLASEGEPRVNVRPGAEITEVMLYPMDGSDRVVADFTADGSISFPASVTDGVAEVSVKYPQGEAEYYFMVERSQTDPSEPPKLGIYSGDIGFPMSRGTYTWTVESGDEAYTVCADCPSPWQMYESGTARPHLAALPGEELTVMLPDNSEITSAVYYTSENECSPLEFSGGKLTMPDENLTAAVGIYVKMPQGSCEYVFSVQTGTEFSSPAYDLNGGQ